jgi:hypothetical protein
MLGVEIWECSFCQNRILVWSRGGRMSEPVVYRGQSGTMPPVPTGNSTGIEPRRVVKELDATELNVIDFISESLVPA